MSQENLRIINSEQLRTVIQSNVCVYYHDVSSGIWFRILSLDKKGKSRLLALLPCDQFYIKLRNVAWRLSWDEDHKKGRIRESYVYMYDKRDRLTTKLPPEIVSLLEVNDCLHLMDDKLFK